MVRKEKKLSKQLCHPFKKNEFLENLKEDINEIV
jgi:hypothetical protein